MLSSHQSAQQAASAVLTKGLRMLQEQCMHTTISLAPVATSARAASRNATPDAGVMLPAMDAFSFSPSDIEVEPVDLCCPASTPRSALTSAFTQLRQSDLAAEAAQVASALADHLAHQQMATLTAFNLVGSPSGYRQQQQQQQPN